jgi:imidazolonepropionase
MQLVMSMACIRYRLTPEEALNATTLNTAYAMGVSDELGSITRGKTANLIVTEPMTQLEFIPYYYGTNKVAKMILNGKFV